MLAHKYMTLCFIWLLLIGCSGQSDPDSNDISENTTNAAVTAEVTTPPEQIVNRLSIDTNFYRQYLDSDGFPILASAKVNPYALLEARWVIKSMLANRPDLMSAIASTGTRFAVMAVDEFTTDVPEHSDLIPANYWDRRARGLGATNERPAVSSGEENILQLPGDPYSTESIVVHEFAHAIHQQGLNTLDESFDAKLISLFSQAMDEGLWQDTYAATNPAEYFAEGVQSWFGTNRENDLDHNDIDTREELIAYDIRLAELLEQIFGDNQWQYQGPKNRQNEIEHLSGFDVNTAGSFSWPDHLVNVDLSEGVPTYLNLDPLPNLIDEDWSNIVTPSISTVASTIDFVNATNETVTVRWIDFEGQRIEYSNLVLGPDGHGATNTFEGHLFEVVGADKTTVIAQFRAEAEPRLAYIE